MRSPELFLSGQDASKRGEPSRSLTLGLNHGDTASAAADTSVTNEVLLDCKVDIKMDRRYKIVMIVEGRMSA